MAAVEPVYAGKLLALTTALCTLMTLPVVLLVSEHC